MALVLVFVVIGLAGAVIGVVVTLRVARRAARADPHGAESGLNRLQAEVHTGSEQVMIGLVRELGLPRGQATAGYGALYTEPSGDTVLLVRSRSAVDRGLTASITLKRARGHTAVSYAIVRLPGDDVLRERVLQFELMLVGALRRIDAGANISLSSTALRDFDRTRRGDQSSAAE